MTSNFSVPSEARFGPVGIVCNSQAQNCYFDKYELTPSSFQSGTNNLTVPEQNRFNSLKNTCSSKAGTMGKCCDAKMLNTLPPPEITKNMFFKVKQGANGKMTGIQYCKCDQTDLAAKLKCQQEKCAGFRRPTNYLYCKVASSGRDLLAGSGVNNIVDIPASSLGIDCHPSQCSSGITTTTTATTTTIGGAGGPLAANAAAAQGDAGWFGWLWNPTVTAAQIQTATGQILPIQTPPEISIDRDSPAYILMIIAFVLIGLLIFTSKDFIRTLPGGIGATPRGIGGIGDIGTGLARSANQLFRGVGGGFRKLFR